MKAPALPVLLRRRAGANRDDGHIAPGVRRIAQPGGEKRRLPYVASELGSRRGTRELRDAVGDPPAVAAADGEPMSGATRMTYLTG